MVRRLHKWRRIADEKGERVWGEGGAVEQIIGINWEILQHRDITSKDNRNKEQSLGFKIHDKKQKYSVKERKRHFSVSYTCTMGPWLKHA